MGFQVNGGNFGVTIPNASTTQDGLQSSTDKANLNALVAAAGSGTSDNVISPTSKSLSNNVATSLFNVNMALISDNSFSCKLFFAVECTDGNDVQVRSGDLNANLVLKNGTYNTSTNENATTSKTAGSITTTFSWSTSGNTATLQITVATSITPTQLVITFFIPYSTHPAVTLA